MPKCTMTRSGRPEYFDGFEEGTHRILWTEDLLLAVRFADMQSARKVGAAALRRPAYVVAEDASETARWELAQAGGRHED